MNSTNKMGKFILTLSFLQLRLDYPSSAEKEELNLMTMNQGRIKMMMTGKRVRNQVWFLEKKL